MLQVEQVERLRTVTWNISEEFALKVPIDLVETEELNLGIDTLSREVRTSVPPKESPNWEEEFSVEGEGVPRREDPPREKIREFRKCGSGSIRLYNEPGTVNGPTFTMDG